MTITTTRTSLTCPLLAVQRYHAALNRDRSVRLWKELALRLWCASNYTLNTGMQHVLRQYANDCAARAIHQEWLETRMPTRRAA